jgi:two-component system response regulator
MAKSRWNVLLVEDNDDDAFIVERACKKSGVPVTLTRCPDGQQAFDYLQTRAAEPSALPHLVLLDLKIPLKSGLEVLRSIRANKKLQELIVVILTSSGESRDVKDAYRLRANAYLVKPPSLAGMLEVIQVLRLGWLDRFDALFDGISGVA